jgi:hypothetical protein
MFEAQLEKWIEHKTVGLSLVVDDVIPVQMTFPNDCQAACDRRDMVKHLQNHRNES